MILFYLSAARVSVRAVVAQWRRTPPVAAAAAAGMQRRARLEVGPGT
jgi:hypothetical protein